jgi:DNA (cytosine-5)-methyltransferase 1
MGKIVDMLSQSLGSFREESHTGPQLGEYLRQREKGWVYRGDRVTERNRSREKRTPQVSRYSNVKKILENDLFNAGWCYVDTQQVKKDQKIFNCVDLFSGCGGLTLGFEQANYRSLIAVEVDQDAAATYKKNFPDAYVWASKIESLTNEKLKEIIGNVEIHALLAGFPCQGFSVAGQRNPKDERNVLFREVLRAAKVLHPWFLVLENVPGIVTISKGTVFQAIRKEFAEIGYPNMSTLVLESADFGVPQYRPRAIFIANRFGLPNPYPKPILEPKNYMTIEAAIDDLKHQPRNVAINHDWTYHSPDMEKRIAEVEPGGSLYDSYTDAWKRQYKGAPAMTIKENHGGTHIHYELNRTISSREMARLQGFPDSFLFVGRMKRVMFQIGNAVPPILACHIALALRPTFEKQAANIRD